MVSDQGLHSLPYILQYFRHQELVDWTMLNFRTHIGSRLGAPVLRVIIVDPDQMLQIFRDIITYITKTCLFKYTENLTTKN